MVEDAVSSNAPESQRTRIPPSMVVWTPIGNAWLETLRQARRSRKRSAIPHARTFAALASAADELAREHKWVKRARRAAPRSVRIRRPVRARYAVFVFQLLVVHPAHAAHATAAWHGRSTLLRRLGHHGFGGDHEAGDRCRVL